MEHFTPAQDWQDDFTAAFINLAPADFDEVVKLGYNGIIVNAGYGLESVLRECEQRGLYVIVRAPIDTSP